MTPPRIALALDGPAPALLGCARRALQAVAAPDFADAAVDGTAQLAACDAVLAERPLPELAGRLGHATGLLAVRAIAPLAPASPLAGRRAARIDLLLVHGLGRGADANTAELAFRAAERRAGRLAAVTPGAGPWRDAVDRLAGEYPDVTVEHVAGAEAAAQLVARPARFDVLACEPAAGGVLAGVAAALTGLEAMAAVATAGARAPGVFTPYRATAAGSTANPLPVLLAAAMLLRQGLGMEAEAERLEVAVELALETGLRTPDLLLGEVGERRAGTEALAAAVLSELGS